MDEDGTCQPFVKPSTLGGMGLFTKGKPMPIEYKRDGSLRNAGFLTIEENDERVNSPNTYTFSRKGIQRITISLPQHDVRSQLTTADQSRMPLSETMVSLASYADHIVALVVF